MREMKKIFAVSDVKGYLAPLLSALGEAGFDETDPHHLFVGCGNLFGDEGEDGDVFRFVTGLKNKVLIRGNRDERLTAEMVDYLETARYVFVSGWLPTAENGAWRGAPPEAWHAARSIGWFGFYGVNDVISEKTLVCGNGPTRLAYAFDGRDLGDSGIYYGEGMIAIDAGTASSGRVNVLVLEDEIK